MKTIIATTLAASAGAALAGPSLVAETLWDTGTFEGWTFTDGGSTGGTWVNPGSGGNPGGFVQYIDGTDGQAAPPQLSAPSAYLGDYNGLIGGFFQYDVRIDAAAGDGSDATNYPRIRLFGADGSIARAALDVQVTNDWQQVTISIVESDWQMVSGTWAGLIGDVNGLYFGGDVLLGGGPEGAVDNFRLFIPAPGATALLGLAGLTAARRRR